MGFLAKTFTWWNGATLGTRVTTRFGGTRVGEDRLGNVYYQGKPIRNGIRKRWVIYNGSNDASRVPPEWHPWLHHQVEELPDVSLPPPRRWEKEGRENLTGTNMAYRPPGALEAGGRRPRVSGDYEAWSPDDE